MATREAVFGSRELSGMIKTFADNSRNELCTDLFKKGMRIVSDDPRRVEWDERTFNETLAPVVGMTEEPPALAMPSEKNKVASMIKLAHVVSIPAERLFYDREVGDLKPNAPSVVADALQDGLNRTMRSVELLCSLALLDNFVINSSVIPASKTPSFTLSWGNDTITATDWSTTSTAIVSTKVKAMVDQYRQNSGLLPGMALLNSTTEGYLLANAEIQDLLAGFPGAAAIYQSDHRGTAVMNGLGIGGMTWTKHLGGYKADGSTWTDFIATDKVVMLPQEAQLRGVLGFAEGYNLVPAKLWGQGGDAASQVMRAPSPGLSVYSELKTRPMRVELVIEWLGLPIIMHPKAVLVASV